MTAEKEARSRFMCVCVQPGTAEYNIHHKTLQETGEKKHDWFNDMQVSSCTAFRGPSNKSR